MRLNINLATQPYQDVRRFLFRWGFAVAVVAVLSIALLWGAIGSIRSWRKTTRQVNDYRSKIAACDRERANAEALLNRPENRSTRDQSVFINTLIARKAFSWTQVLSDLERIMPSGIHVLGITPDISDDNELQLKLTAVGSSREQAVELISRLESSPHFRNALLRNDVAEQQQSQPNSRPEIIYHFEITATYVPPYQRPSDGSSEADASVKGGQ